MKLEDIITLAKAGYTPKQVKELLEMVETSPQVKEATVEEVENKEITQGSTEEKKEEKVNTTDPLAIFDKLLEN